MVIRVRIPYGLQSLAAKLRGFFLCEDANQACLIERLSIKKAWRRRCGAKALGKSNAKGNIVNNPLSTLYTPTNKK
ncbi:MAG TPA: hypothetical protein DCP55_02680 [Chitinophagaceae bacterium]|nr:hypothetical protein [Chitinophagaceae bacterium]